MNAATIGHNRPAETPFDAITSRIDLLHMEAQNWLDGSGVETQGQADTVAKLLDDARRAKKEADDLRKLEVKPLDDARKEVQERFKPWLAKTDLIAGLCKQALAPFLAARDAEKREVERKAREEAERKAEEARKAHEASKDSTDIAERERAEAAIAEAQQAKKAAVRAGKDKGHAKGSGRAVSLRTSYAAEVTDHQLFARYVWTSHQDDLREWLDDFAGQLVRRGVHTMPGVTVHEKKEAV